MKIVAPGSSLIQETAKGFLMFASILCGAQALGTFVGPLFLFAFSVYIAGVVAQIENYIGIIPRALPSIFLLALCYLNYSRVYEKHKYNISIALSLLALIGVVLTFPPVYRHLLGI